MGKTFSKSGKTGKPAAKGTSKKVGTRAIRPTDPPKP